MMRVVEPLPMYRDVKHGVSSLMFDILPIKYSKVKMKSTLEQSASYINRKIEEKCKIFTNYYDFELLYNFAYF